MACFKISQDSIDSDNDDDLSGSASEASVASSSDSDEDELEESEVELVQRPALKASFSSMRGVDEVDADGKGTANSIWDDFEKLERLRVLVIFCALYALRILVAALTVLKVIPDTARFPLTVGFGLVHASHATDAFRADFCTTSTSDSLDRRHRCQSCWQRI